MLLLSRLRLVAIAVVLGVVCTACQSKTASKPAEPERKPVAVVVDAKAVPEPSPQPVAKTASHSAPHRVKPQPPPPPPTIPKVALSNELRAACLINVGDTMPEAELADSAGKLHALESLYGQKLTVVCLWTVGTTHRSQLVAAAALQDLMREIADPFGPKGVGVIGINVGNPVAAVKEEVGRAGAAFPNLLDPKGEYFAKIAKDKRMPRTFLLDAAGRVLWFDVEYSRPSRRDLTQSVRVALGEL